MNINQEYHNIIEKCKFISKPNEWFVEGTEAKLMDKVNYDEYTVDSKFNDGWGLFDGLTNEPPFIGFDEILPREDEETCPFFEFLIYDEHGNDITELTLEEYKELIKKTNLITKYKTHC